MNSPAGTDAIQDNEYGVRECLTHYPRDLLDVRQMNQAVRHRLRNFVYGLQMAVNQVSSQVEETFPDVTETCDIIIEESDKLQRLTERMDWVFGTLPEPRPGALLDVLQHVRDDFARSYPFCSLCFEGAESNVVFKRGSWLKTALTEFAQNAGATMAETGGTVTIAWDDGPPFSFTVSSPTGPWPDDIPRQPPQPFFSSRGGHDGLGLAIVQRLAYVMQGNFSLTSEDDVVVARLTIPAEECMHEQVPDSDRGG